MVVKGPNDIVIKYILRLVFKVINNIIEYETLSKNIDLVKEIKPKKVSIYNDF